VNRKIIKFFTLVIAYSRVVRPCFFDRATLSTPAISVAPTRHERKKGHHLQTAMKKVVSFFGKKIGVRPYQLSARVTASLVMFASAQYSTELFR